VANSALRQYRREYDARRTASFKPRPRASAPFAVFNLGASSRDTIRASSERR
jgi:hypothetical protein